MKIGDYDLRMPIVRRDDGSIQVAITPEGKVEAESYTGSGPKFAVLATLNEHSPQTIRGICRETNLETSKVRAILGELKKKQHVRKIQDVAQDITQHEVQG